MEDLCGSFRRAAPFVDHLPNKKIYYKVTKENDQMIFQTWFLFIIQGVRFRDFKWYVRKTKIILEFVIKKDSVITITFS